MQLFYTVNLLSTDRVDVNIISRGGGVKRYMKHNITFPTNENLMPKVRLATPWKMVMVTLESLAVNLDEIFIKLLS